MKTGTATKLLVACAPTTLSLAADQFVSDNLLTMNFK